MSRGTTHSCGLTPPCSYVLFASKQEMPGATAMRTSWSQCHGTVGTRQTAPSLTRAQRPFLVSVTATGRSSFFGSPPGSEQPAVVGDDRDTCCQPASSSSSIRAAIRCDLVVELVDQVDAEVVAAAGRVSPVSVQADAGWVADVVGPRAPGPPPSPISARSTCDACRRARPALDGIEVRARRSSGSGRSGRGPASTSG